MKLRISWAWSALLPLALALYWIIGSRPAIRIDAARLAAPMIEVRADAAGTLAHIHQEEGAWVEEGNVLFSLNAADEEANLAEMQAGLETLHQKLSSHLAEAEAAMQDYLNARSEEANGLPVHSEQHLARLGMQQSLAEQCRKEAAGMQERAELVKSAIQRKQISSPASGYLIECKREEGETVAAGDPVCLLCNTKKIWIEAVVPESFASKIRIGQTAIAALPSDPSLQWAGELSWISPIALPGHAGIPVRISLKEGDPPGCLRPNMQVQLTLTTP